MKRGGSVAAVLVLLAGAGCRTAGSASAPVAVASPATRPRRIHWVRSAAEYPAATVQAYRMATRRIDVVGASMVAGDVGRLPGRGRDRPRQLAVHEGARRRRPAVQPRELAGVGGAPRRGARSRERGVPAPREGDGRHHRHRHQPHAGRVPRHRGELPRPRAALRPDVVPSRGRARRQGAALRQRGQRAPRVPACARWRSCCGSATTSRTSRRCGRRRGRRGRSRSWSSAGGSSSSPTRCTGPGRTTPRSEPAPRAPRARGRWLRRSPGRSPRSRRRWGGRRRRTARAGSAGS